MFLGNPWLVALGNCLIHKAFVFPRRQQFFNEPVNWLQSFRHYGTRQELDMNSFKSVQDVALAK